MRVRDRTGDQKWVREHNLSLVLTQIWREGKPISRSTLTKKVGLNKSTVGNILSELQTMGFVSEIGLSKTGVGRPAVTIEINSKRAGIIGIEIGVGFLSLVVADLNAKVLWREYSSVTEKGQNLLDASQIEVMQRLDQMIGRAIDFLGEENRQLLGFGVGLPGLTDQTTGTLLQSLNLGWRNLPVKDILVERYRIPVLVGNEAKVAATGEYFLGAAKNAQNFLYISTSVGIGGTLFMDGNLILGENDFAGEIGHMIIDPNGPLCVCGSYGCLEAMVGPNNVLNRIRKSTLEGNIPVLFELYQGNTERIQMEDIRMAADRGDSVVLECISRVSHNLGVCIADLIYILDPGLVVLGGTLSVLGPFLLEPIQAEINKHPVMSFRKKVQFTFSQNKVDACAIGGVALILKEILKNPARWWSRSSFTI